MVISLFPSPSGLKTTVPKPRSRPQGAPPLVRLGFAPLLLVPSPAVISYYSALAGCTRWGDGGSPYEFTGEFFVFSSTFVFLLMFFGFFLFSFS